MTAGSRTRLVAILISAAVLAAQLLFIHARAYSANDASRMAAIESLVHRGTWAIDDASFQTIDRIKVGDQFFSDKPPMMAFIGAAVYYPLHHLLGWTLQSGGCLPATDPAGCRFFLAPAAADWAYVTLTLLLVALPGAALPALLYLLARRQQLPNWAAIPWALLTGLGTALLPYSTVFSNHVPAAAALATALYLLLTRHEPGPGTKFAIGFLAVLATTLDLSAGAFLLAILAICGWRWRAANGWTAAGAALPALVMIVLDFQIVGNPLPPQLYAQGYAYEGSVLYSGISGFSSAANRWQYGFDMLVGSQGVIPFFPLLLLYLYGLLAAMRRPGRSDQPVAVAVGLATVVYVLYFILATDNFGGIAYSPRWLLIPVPLLAAFAWTPAMLRPRAAVIGLFLLLGGISVWSAWRGAADPWRQALPPLRLVWADPQPPRTIDAVLSGYDSFPAAQQTLLEAGLEAGFRLDDDVRRRYIDARGGLVVPPARAWWLVDASTPLAPALAEPLGLPAQGEFALEADLSAAADAWIASLATTAWQSDTLVPAGAGELRVVNLPQQFTLDSATLALLAFDTRLKDDALQVITAWRIETAPAGTRALFAHVLDESGQIVAQDDAWRSSFATLQPGDLFFQVQTLPLTAVLPGMYWLQIGLYEPDSGRRLAVDGQDRLLLLNWTRSEE